MANLIRWDPYREMTTLRNAMDRLVDSAVIGPGAAWQPEALTFAVDVIENADAFIVKASIPGIKPEDLDVTYNNNILTIKGEIKEEEVIEDARYQLRERRFGSFTRSFSMPTNLNSEAIKADYEQGVLTLTLPKAEEARPRRIMVESPQMIAAKAANNKN